MKDSLAFYSLTTDRFEQLGEADLIMDSEVPGYLERKGRFVSDLFLDGKAVGDVLKGLTTIMGAPVNGLVGGSGFAIEPSGPVVYTSRIARDDLELIITTLAKASSLLAGNVGPGDEERAQRLGALAEQLGDRALRQTVGKIQRYVESARNVPDELIAVYTKFSA